MKKEGETGTLRIVSLEGDLELDKAHKCHLFYGPKTIRLFLLTPWNYSFKHQEPVSLSCTFISFSWGVTKGTLTSVVQEHHQVVKCGNVRWYGTQENDNLLGFYLHGASLVAQLVKNTPAMQETGVGKIPWRRKWLPTPVCLREFHGQRSLAGKIPKDRKG